MHGLNVETLLHFREGTHEHVEAHREKQNHIAEQFALRLCWVFRIVPLFLASLLRLNSNVTSLPHIGSEGPKPQASVPKFEKKKVSGAPHYKATLWIPPIRLSGVKLLLPPNGRMLLILGLCVVFGVFDVTAINPSFLSKSSGEDDNNNHQSIPAVFANSSSPTVAPTSPSPTSSPTESRVSELEAHFGVPLAAFMLLVLLPLNVIQLIAYRKHWQFKKEPGAIIRAFHRHAAVSCIAFSLQWGTQGFVPPGVLVEVGYLLNNFGIYAMSTWVLYAAYHNLKSAFIVANYRFPDFAMKAIFILLAGQWWITTSIQYTWGFVANDRMADIVSHLGHITNFFMLLVLNLVTTWWLLKGIKQRDLAMKDYRSVEQPTLRSQVSRHLRVVLVICVGSILSIAGFSVYLSERLAHGRGLCFVCPDPMSRREMILELLTDSVTCLVLAAGTWITWTPFICTPVPQSLTRSLLPSSQSRTKTVTSAKLVFDDEPSKFAVSEIISEPYQYQQHHQQQEQQEQQQQQQSQPRLIATVEEVSSRSNSKVIHSFEGTTPKSRTYLEDRRPSVND